MTVHRYILVWVAAATLIAPTLGRAQAGPQESYDYWQFNRAVVWRGMQAMFMCHGLFVSNRTLEQVFEQELAFIPEPVGSAAGGDYVVDRERRAVAVGAAGPVPTMRAAHRQGVGCVAMAPDQTFDDIDELPEIDVPAVAGDPATIAWPDGDFVAAGPLPDAIDAKALQAASDWAFDRATDEQDTLSLIVVHDGKIVHERYAPGIDVTTRTRTWSTAKSIAATLIGMAVEDGLLALDAPLGIDWLPQSELPTDDPREAITLRQVLQMSSGMYPVDNNRLEYATGSGLAYWAGANSVRMLQQGALIREPGTHWDYENLDTLRAIYALKRAIGDEDAYHTFARRRLLDKIGMRNTVLGMDRFGNFILSSQVYTNARDLARFGLLYLNDGIWKGERLVSKDWIEFVRTPAPATSARGNFYGGQFWLVPDNRKGEVPASAYATAGNRGQYVVVVPSHDVVIVRRGLDYGKQGFNRWDLTREVLKAFAAPGE
ncbi:MAG: serine hydrolase [Pseudomonadota bacterium]